MRYCFDSDDIITFLGANSLFGRVATALLSKTPYVRTLKLYDEVEKPQLGPTGIPTCQVQWHRGKEELSTALQGSDIVVIGDDNKVILNSEKDALISSASKVVDFVYAVAQTSPKAMVVVAASPLNLMVPLAGYVLKELGCYDGRKLLGVTSVDTLRANAIYSEYIDQPNSILPVVGGASPQTRVPIFSHARPSLDLSEEDKHHLIDKIKSFDLKMEGPEFKASTLERAYATVRLVNSLLSGLREEPSTKEMALAKTSLIPEVNYFSLPVDLGKFGIERTFGLPQLSQLETEMIDYAIINLNNDLIKAQDLYASFKPCFEMLKSIVGCSSNRCSTDVTNEVSAMLCDSKTDINKNKDQKTKERSIKRKRSEQHLRNRKRTRTNKFPIIHCPAPEVVTDKPIEEKFGKIERAHKKLQVNQIFQERNSKELPMLKSNKTTDLDSSLNQLNDTRGSLGNLINKSVVKSLDLTNKNNVSVPLYIKEDTKAQLPSLDNKLPKTIDLMDLQNNSKAIHKAANQKFDCKNVLVNMEVLEDKPDISKDAKVATDLKGKVKKHNVYEHLQAQAQSQSARIEMIKSLMLQKQNQNKKTKDLNFSDTTASNDKMEYLKKKAMELKTPYNTRFSNKPHTPKLHSSEKHKTMDGEYYNGTISKMQTNKNSSIDKQSLGKLKQTNTTISGKDTVDKTQYISMKNGIEVRNGTGISKQDIKTEIEAKGCQETGILEKKVSRNEEDVCRDLLESKGSINLIADSSINYEIERKIGLRSCSENIAQVERSENAYEGNKIKETNEKVYKEDGKDLLQSITYDETNNGLASMHNKYISAAYNKAGKINKNNIITKEKVAVPEVENGTTKNISDCITSNVHFGKNDETETREINKHIHVVSRAETKKEDEKQLNESCKHEVNKKEDEKFNEEMSHLICEVADSNKTGKEICKQQFCFTDEGKEIEVQGKLKNEEYLSKRQGRENLKENDQKIFNAITSKVSCDPLEQVNKDADVTIQKLKEPSKSPNILKLEKSSDKENVEEKLKEKKLMETIETEETKEIKRIKACDIEVKVPEAIEVFNYAPQKLPDTRNMTNINDIVQGLVKTSIPEAKSEIPIVEQKPIQTIKDQVHVDSKAIRMKVMDLNKKAGQLAIKRKQQSKGKNLKKGEQRANASNEKVELKKQPKETPFPILEMPKEEGFDKNKWLKQRVQTVRKINSPKKSNLKNIDESKALTIYSRNINESFTKIVHGSNKTSDKIKSVSYAVDTKIKKDELSKRYTVLKKGQLCNMVKDDINANEVKAKLYQNSQIKATLKSIDKKDDNRITIVKGSESSKTLPTNKEISISGPSPNVLIATKKVSYNLRTDVNNSNNSNKGNNNSITLNKSFLNLVINRISKRSPTLNEKSEAIGVRGSHYGSGRYSKPNKSDEEKIQQLTKRAKEQLTLTKFKNNKRISHGLSGSLPFVSNELSEIRQPAKDKGLDKPKSHKDVTDNMMRTKNKIQLMKERHQRLRNENQLPKNVVKSPPPTGMDIVKSKDKKIIFYGVKNPITEISNKSSSKSIIEQKYDVEKDETESKQDESHSEKPIKEITLNTAGKTKSELNDQYHHHDPYEIDESLIDINNNSKQGINSSDVLYKKHSNETEEKCSELSQNQNSTSFDNIDKTMITHKKYTQENQSSEDTNKSIKECFDKKQESPKTIEDDGNNISNVKQLKDETTKKIENVENKKNNPSTQQFTPKKKVFHDRVQEIGKFKAKQGMKENKDVNNFKKSKNTISKEKFQQPKMNLAHKNALMSVKSAKEKSKSVNEHKQRAALQAVFSSRPTTLDLMKMNQEQKTDTPNITAEKVPPLNFGVRPVVGSNLIPRHSTASSLLIDPDIERRPSASRKEIHPSLMHAVKPFHSQKTDLTKLKTNFYSRWTPQTLKMKGNKEGAQAETKNDRLQKNPFVSGKINLTSDLFKAYMKQNRNHEFSNSNGDVQFLHQSGQLASIPQQGISGATSRINDQRVAFSTLEANSEKKMFSKHEIIKSKPRVSKDEKTSRSRNSLFSKSKRINNILKEAPSNGPQAKGKSALQGSHKSLSKNKPVLNKSKEKLAQSSNPIRLREKEIDLKRIHLLKAFKNQDKNEMKFGELQRNYKKQLIITPKNSIKIQCKELSKEAPNRLQMLKGRSVESIKPLKSEDKRHNKKPFSAPGDYHSSFPLSKPKKYENNKKKDECGNSTLKKRWTQLLDIFQSVITTEKKNWEQDGAESNLLVVGGPHLPKNAIVPKAKIVLRETSPNPDSTGKRVQTYYKRHSVGGSKLQNIYPPANRTNKM